MKASSILNKIYKATFDLNSIISLKSGGLHCFITPLSHVMFVLLVGTDNYFSAESIFFFILTGIITSGKTVYIRSDRNLFLLCSEIRDGTDMEETFWLLEGREGGPR